MQPDYALAWARLARTYMGQINGGEASPREAAEKARRAAQRALEIDPGCALAHYALGNIHWWYDYDWAAAKKDFEAALALDPQGEIGPDARINLGELAAGQSGRSADVIRLYLERIRVNPLDTLEISGLIWHLQFSGQLKEAAATSRRLLDLNPSFGTAQAQYAQTLLLMGQFSEALAVAERESNEPSRLAVLACIYWTMGHKSESTAAVEKLAGVHARTSAYLIADSYAWRNDVDAAFTWLAQAYQQHDGLLAWIKSRPHASQSAQRFALRCVAAQDEAALTTRREKQENRPGS